MTLNALESFDAKPMYEWIMIQRALLLKKVVHHLHHLSRERNGHLDIQRKTPWQHNTNINNLSTRSHRSAAMFCSCPNTREPSEQIFQTLTENGLQFFNASG